jgi:hypothetical protein
VPFEKDCHRNIFYLHLPFWLDIGQVINFFAIFAQQFKKNKKAL